ncbi:hypothetical protein KM176_21205 [Pseudooceanicola sp. CBS1P-1]|uniref:Uncharacterized protein n=1 Tax=Pseudooceanicola albus TaxID=2692189 RepID=A0A6L7GCA5_9RHOB|nr:MULTISPECIES: hypothetical protein [Pseudooceanicola]MBT9386399.1 hypothetical protein [Pseudooceanicola endophyticus]MXN20443.1 hypothetical protein [Pseudooceanicola albus]
MKLGLWGILGLILGIVLAELVVRGNQAVYLGVVSLCTMLGTAIGVWRRNRNPGRGKG